MIWAAFIGKNSKQTNLDLQYKLDKMSSTRQRSKQLQFKWSMNEVLLQKRAKAENQKLAGGCANMKELTVAVK